MNSNEIIEKHKHSTARFCLYKHFETKIPILVFIARCLFSSSATALMLQYVEGGGVVPDCCAVRFEETPH